MITEQQETLVKELFKKLPTAYTGNVETGEIKMINYSIFLSIVENIAYENSYTKGYLDGMKNMAETSDRVIESVFAKQ